MQLRELPKIFTSWIGYSLFSSEDSNSSSRSADQDRDSSGDSLSPQNYETEMLKLATQENRAYIEQQISSLTIVKNRASTIIQLNLVVVGSFFTLSSFLLQEDLFSTQDLVNGTLPFAVLGSGLSLTLAVLVFREEPLKAGLSPKDIDNILQQEPTTNEYLVSLLRGHRNWIGHNNEVNNQITRKIRYSFITLFLSMGLYGTTVLIAF